MLEVKVNTKAVTGKNDDSFIGIKINNHEIDFYYPETYSISKMDDLKEFREDVLSILKTIEIAKTMSVDKTKIESSLADTEKLALMSYLWIINDYLANGFYINREREYKLNQRGKINWKRTLKNQPIVSKGNVIYNNLVVEVRNNMDNLLVDIHKYCVKESIRIIGWLFNLDSSRIETKPFNSTIKKMYITALKNEIDKTFDDYKKLRLNHMLKVIKGLDGNNSTGEFVYGVDTYFYIYERMIDSIFGSQDNMKDFNPKANWYLVKDSFKKKKSSELRPDTILMKDDIAYILDSKYYRFGFTGLSSDLPETTSIQKQITYGDYLKQNAKINIKDIRNAFILPYNRNDNPFKVNELIQYIGFSMAEWKDNSVNKHESIYAFLVDTKHVIKCWNKNNHEEDIELLVSLIENAIIEKEKLPKEQL